MTLSKAIRIAAVGFEGITDKSGEPYIMHCIRVMNHMDTVKEKILAILHDVVEDGVMTIEQLRAEEFEEDILDDLKLLTHTKDVPYDDYIRKIASSPRATKVKKGDLRDNSDITRLKGLSHKDFLRIEKYNKAWVYLSSI